MRSAIPCSVEGSDCVACTSNPFWTTGSEMMALSSRLSRAAIGCGNVHVWDPAEYTGGLNSGVTRAGVLAVYGDGGQGGERTNQSNHKLEYGLLGVTTAPDFMQTGHIYMQYFPSFNPSSSRMLSDLLK